MIRQLGMFVLGVTLFGCVQVAQPPDAIELSDDYIPTTWVSDEDFSYMTSNSQAEVFNAIKDESLLAVVNEALANNLSLKADREDLLALAMAARQSAGQLLPNVEFNSNVFRGRTQSLFIEDGEFSKAKSLQFLLNWELDVWGRLRAADASEQAVIEQAGYGIEAQQQALVALVTRQWLNLWLVAELISLEEERIAIFTVLEEIASEQYQSGLQAYEDLPLARISLRTAQATLRSLRFEQDSIARQLEVTMGRYPTAELSFKSKLPEIEKPLLSMPGQLIANRPDVQSAYARVHEAHFDKEALNKALLPTIALTATASKSRPSWSDLLESNLLWNVIGGLAQNLFVQDLLGTGPISVAKAAKFAEQAVTYRYQQTVLSAFLEVENALQLERVLFARQQLLADAVKDADEVYTDYLQRYQDGLFNLVDVLTVQERLIESRQMLLDVQAELRFNRVSLGLALGMTVTVDS